MKDRTSSTVGTEEDGGVLFDETIAAYSGRRKRAEEFLSEALVETHRKAFRAYLQRPQWSTIAEDSSAGDSYQLAVTSELDEPLRVSACQPAGDLITPKLTSNRFSNGIWTSSPEPSGRPSSAASGEQRSRD